MPLHRDIHWIGRQWAVTGHGMQLIDQKLQGFFDIEVSRLWDDDLIESMHAKEWLNAADFDKGLVIARARHPQPPGVETPRQAAPVAAIQPVTPLEPAVKPIERKSETPKLEIPKPVAPILPKPASAPPLSAVPAAPLRPAIARDASKPVVPTLIKPGSVEPGLAGTEPLASAIATRASSAGPLRPPALIRRRDQGRA